MIGDAVARRYSQALFAIGRERGTVDQLQQELQLIHETLAADAGLQRLVLHKLISPERKLEALDKVFQGRISGTVRAFLQIMLKRRREAHLPAILAVFRQTADEARKVVEAEVRSAVPVDGRQLEDLAGRFSRALGMTVRLKQVIDPDLLGGVVVKLGDRLYDGSVRSRLVRLKSRLLGAELSQEGVDR